MNYHLSPKAIQELIITKLSHNIGVTLQEATDEHVYKALALIVRDLVARGQKEFSGKVRGEKKKTVYYLCMEFLMGRSLHNNLYNLGLEDAVREALNGLDIRLEKIYNQEPDPGLGNGGLGRLAACFLDGLATGGYGAMGYSLRYEYGIFRQTLVDGWQTELPDFWLPGGEVWLVPYPEKTKEVHFDGRVEENWDGSYHQIVHHDYTTVNAIPYDLMVPGLDGKGVSVLRLWAADSSAFDISSFNEGAHVKAVEQKAMAESITKVLYPGDDSLEGKSLRLSQQYFLVSATIQDIIHRHLRQNPSLDNLPELAAIHLNDTHPVLAIPELMRIMLDECGYTWKDAWDIVHRTVAYTNHTVMSEALEMWSEDLFKRRLPRIYQIICELNNQHCALIKSLTGGDEEKVHRMSCINDGYIKMANLAVASCHSVNGVSQLHSNILKDRLFHDFYTVMPDKFKNVTNGIAIRRWLCQANPRLTGLISELIGDGFIRNADELETLMPFSEDSGVLKKLADIKRANKAEFSDHIFKTNGVRVNPDSIFDVQVKRLHEYKRQHLNAMHILSAYQYLKENPNADFVPRTYIFAGKAASSYYLAKEIIQFIVTLGDIINNDPVIGDKLKVVFLEDYRVTLAERLMPAADLSEQISLAGTEASGTGNMKLMINGAVTLGTMDGANVEIHGAVGSENIIIFGLTTPEAETLKKNGYDPKLYFNNNQTLRNVINDMMKGMGGHDFSGLANLLITEDQYMALADFTEYTLAQQRSAALYQDTAKWSAMSLVNTAKAGIFSADRAIRDYAQNIWMCKGLNGK